MHAGSQRHTMLVRYIIIYTIYRVVGIVMIMMMIIMYNNITYYMYVKNVRSS